MTVNQIRYKRTRVKDDLMTSVKTRVASLSQLALKVGMCYVKVNPQVSMYFQKHYINTLLTFICTAIMCVQVSRCGAHPCTSSSKLR